MIIEYKKRDFSISNDKRKLQLKVIYNFLTNCYWDKGIGLEEVREKIRNSYCFGLYHNNTQIGFCRVITDFVTLSYLADVFIVEKHRGKGLSKWLMKCVINHSDLRQVKTWMLKTSDAHGLYAKYGFRRTTKPNEIMEMKKKRNK